MKLNWKQILTNSLAAAATAYSAAIAAGATTKQAAIAAGTAILFNLLGLGQKQPVKPTE